MATSYLNKSPIGKERHDYIDCNKENDCSEISNNSTPVIKRKSIDGSFSNNSPYVISSGFNTSINADLNMSPCNLNESCEAIDSLRECGFLRRVSNPLIRRKSAPINLGLNSNSMSGDLREAKPLNDISNSLKSKVSNINDMRSFIMPVDDIPSIGNDSITELENLCFGDQQQIQHQHSKIKYSLEVDATCDNLIGDRSRKHVLPVIKNIKHQDLYCISPSTLVDVLDGKYNDKIDKCIIIDSRYPYEFEGGHILTALNLFTQDKLYEEMFRKRLKQNGFYSKDANKRSIIVFHCEFSSERGPKMLRFLRNEDRSINAHNYPNLCYPEIYLLEGGYKLFYENFKSYCDPQSYKPMLHAEHLEDLKHFRAKAKTWEISRHSSLRLNERLLVRRPSEQYVRSNIHSVSSSNAILVNSKHFY